MSDATVYELLKDRTCDLISDEILIGRTWTLCAASGRYGLAMSPQEPRRTLPWPGTLKGKSLSMLADWITSWDPFEACVALSAINASIDIQSLLPDQTISLEKSTQPNLSVFEYFLPRLINKRVVVVGRYPGIEQYETKLDMTVLERNPGQNDLPDSACEYVIADADWVFLSASTIINKTFPRLAELARDTNLVLMGPSVPWLPEMAEFGVDFLAGVEVVDASQLRQVVAEGGGVRIFEDAVNYRIMDLGQKEMAWHHMAISDLVSRREKLKTEMQAWYGKAGAVRFPRRDELVLIDKELSKLDSQYKRLWDARHFAHQQLQ